MIASQANQRRSRLFALLTIAISTLATTPPIQAAEVKPTHKDVVFAVVGDRALKLDLYLPEDTKRPPVVVWIHGGGWRGGSKNKVPIVSLVDEGYAIASIEYRFTKTAIFPAQIHDCKGAVRWLRAKAKTYGYDASRITVAGSSAGGHLALMMGTSGGVRELEGDIGGNLDRSSTVQAIVDYYGPSDFVLRGKTQPERAYTEKSGSFALLGGLTNGKPDESTERFASPITYVDAKDPPLLIFHGTDDKTVLLDQSEAIQAAYKKASLTAKLIVLPKAGHGGAQFFQGKHLHALEAFLAESK